MNLRRSVAGYPPVTLRFFLALAALLLCAAGCRPAEPKADLVIINGAEPESLDPTIVTGQPDLRVVSALFEGLTRSDPKTGSPVPSLAARWDLSPDGRTYTFHLRSNLAWSTGEPIEAGDFVYSWLRVLNPATAADYAGLLFYVKNAEEFNNGKLADPAAVGVRAPDRQTFQVELVSPTPFFLDICALQTLAVVPRQAIEKYGDRWLMTKPLPVSGAYQLAYWRINDKIRLRKNPRYWDAANTQLECVDILPMGNPTTAFNLYETGEADLVWDKDLIPQVLLDVLRKRPDFHSFDNLATYFIRVNVTRKPLNDPRIRRALALAIDKQHIVDKITRAGEKPAPHLTPLGTANYRPPTGLGHDPDQARRLLAEAGYPGGAGLPPVEWQKELGIQVELRQVEWNVLLAAQSSLEYDLARSSWTGDYNDATTFLDLFKSNNGNNRTGWKNPRYDQLLREANAEPDPRRREALLRTAETILVEDELPILPLFFYAGLNYYDARKIQGIYPNLIDQHPINAIRKTNPGSTK